MYLEQLESLTKDSILDEELIDELYEIESNYERTKQLIEVQKRAKELGCLTIFNKLYKAYNKDVASVDLAKNPNRTTFSVLNDDPNGQLICGDWIADDNGVWMHTDKGAAQACYHPIFPTRILRNAETGQYKIELKFQLRGSIRTCLIDKSIVATPTKIVKLADYSIQVNSLTAPYLVKFLSDVESFNPQIKEWVSTSRLGWINEQDENGEQKTMFMPYDKEVVFDNEANTKALFDSIREHGSKDTWYSLIREIRARKQTEVLINLAASYASVLVEPCGALPFIVSLWGGTGIGKTVVLMLATSVWADPSEGTYMTDAKATSTAMEIRLNILNSLPMTLDDMAQVKNQYDEDFSQLIYRWCAGKGRDRSNVNLGLNKLTSWRNCTITNGERSLVDESTQGGAVNRVIDVEASGEALFTGQDGNRVANTLRKNFGHSGKDFIELIEAMPNTDLMAVVNKYFEAIKEEAAKQGCEKEDKQIMPMALILTADELIEEHLFKDGIRLDLSKCVSYLKNKGEVSEHKRAYEYVCDMINSHIGFFAHSKNDMETWERAIPVWGFFEQRKGDVWAAVLPGMFDKLLKEGGFQGRAFKSWAKKQNLLDCDYGRITKKIRTGSTTSNYVVIKMPNEPTEEELADNEECPFI